MREACGIVRLLLELNASYIRPRLRKCLGKGCGGENRVYSARWNRGLQLGDQHGYAGREEGGGERRRGEGGNDKHRVGAHGPFYTTENELELGFSIGGEGSFACDPQLAGDVLLKETGEGVRQDDIGGAFVFSESCPDVSGDGTG